MKSFLFLFRFLKTKRFSFSFYKKKRNHFRFYFRFRNENRSDGHEWLVHLIKSRINWHQGGMLLLNKTIRWRRALFQEWYAKRIQRSEFFINECHFFPEYVALIYDIQLTIRCLIMKESGMHAARTQTVALGRCFGRSSLSCWILQQHVVNRLLLLLLVGRRQRQNVVAEVNYWYWDGDDDVLSGEVIKSCMASVYLGRCWAAIMPQCLRCSKYRPCIVIAEFMRLMLTLK